MAEADHYRFPERHMVKPFRICGKLYFVGDDDVCSYLIDTTDGIILIDTGYPTSQALELNSIYKLGFDPRDIRVILHTHGHYDHFGATRLLQAISGAETYLGWKDAKMFRERSELALCADMGKFAAPELFTPDHEIRDGDRIALGDCTVDAVETPGHTEGTVSYFFQVHEGGQAYRVGIFGGVGRNTMRRSFYEQHHVSGYREMFAASIRRMRREQVDIALGTHTGQAFFWESRTSSLDGAAENPFVDRMRWGAFLDGTERKLQQLLDDESERVQH